MPDDGTGAGDVQRVVGDVAERRLGHALESPAADLRGLFGGQVLGQLVETALSLDQGTDQLGAGRQVYRLRQRLRDAVRIRRCGNNLQLENARSVLKGIVGRDFDLENVCAAPAGKCGCELMYIHPGRIIGGKRQGRWDDWRH